MTDQWFEKHPGLRFERRDHGVLWMIIDRPEKLNATDASLHRSLSRVWDDIDDDDAVDVVVVTGAGEAFSAGGDMEWIESFVGDYEGVSRVFDEASDVVYRMLACRKIIISAINGVAVGAGLAVALMADISLMSEDAKITDGHVRIGVGAGDHANIIWPLLCGMAKAKYYLLTADFIDGATADRIGLVSRSVPGEELLDEAEKVAMKIAAGPRDAIRWTKRSLNLWVKQAAPAFDASAAMEMLSFLGPEAAEGVAAMREKRRPSY
ncbi:MAG: enoyl-CoA hydratase/isomerase family protein [Acidimicrobiales bacterium]|nr:enoyl-CoA hydratase/isomerase family protein [Acidimicrobiia bacterium]NNC81897.1 enoyl-CoA hydratase/isomerase family protein [Acidimicrobiales bacterium]RZV44518.1 MAG: enoyl-CoA hydratase/isomerase family protein [Acidimicrobiales bacterium]